jgi:hypothetical protein
MGMYTELIFGAAIKAKGLPKDVLEVLLYLFEGGEQPHELPTHEYFKCDNTT